MRRVEHAQHEWLRPALDQIDAIEERARADKRFTLELLAITGTAVVGLVVVGYAIATLTGAAL